MASFSKAKIHRFNDDVSCAPPPGRYDPKLDTKIKGAFVQTAKRFPDQLCTSSSLDRLDVSSCDKAVFRTPQQTGLRKLALTPRIQHLREKKFDTPGSGSSFGSTKSLDKLTMYTGLKRADFQRLEQELSTQAEKHLNELRERDQEITKLKEDLEKIKCHENELQLILEKKCTLASKRSIELLEVRNNLNTFVEKINKEREDHQKYIDDLKEEISNLQTEKEDLEAIIEVKQSMIVVINDKFVDVENELKSLREDKEKYEVRIANIMEAHTEMINNVISGAEQQILELDEKLKAKVKSIEQHFDAAHHKYQVDFQTNLNLVSHEFGLKKNEMNSQLEKYSLELEKLKKIVDNKEGELLKGIAEVDERCRFMYRKLCEVEGERDELLVSDLEKNLEIITIQEKADSFENDLKLCKDKCKKFEITLNTMRNTIAALSHRLLESENEVERLSNVKVSLENQKKLLEEKGQLLISDITALRGSMDRMEKDIISDVTAMKEHLTAKVEYFKAEAVKQEEVLNSKIFEKQHTIDLLLDKNKYFETECEGKEKHIAALRHKLKMYEEDVACLKNECSRMENELSKNVTALIAQENLCSALNDKLVTTNEVVSELERVKAVHENQIGTLLEEINKYKTTVLEAEEEINSFENHKIQQSNEINALRQEIQRFTEITKKIKIELSELERDNINKAQNILELSVKIDSLKENVADSVTKISSLKEENSSLKLQLEESKKIISDLKNVEVKNNKELSIKISVLEEIISESSITISSLEAEKSSLSLQLSEAKSNISDLETAVDNKNETINTLLQEKNYAENNYKISLDKIDKLHRDLKKQNDERKMLMDNVIEADYKINELQEKLSLAESEVARKKSVEFESEDMNLKDELETLKLKLQVVVSERDKAERELAELMGHQNIHQKIKHVNQLKQANAEIRERADNLEVENQRLKMRLAEVKENLNIPLPENTQKTPHMKRGSKAPSPAILRPKNNI